MMSLRRHGLGLRDPSAMCPLTKSAWNTRQIVLITKGNIMIKSITIITNEDVGVPMNIILFVIVTIAMLGVTVRI